MSTRMRVEGYATVEDTQRCRDRIVAAGTAHAAHFRDGLGGLALSSIGLGTYLGGHDARTDALYLVAAKVLDVYVMSSASILQGQLCLGLLQ